MDQSGELLLDVALPHHRTLRRNHTLSRRVDKFHSGRIVNGAGDRRISVLAIVVIAGLDPIRANIRMMQRRGRLSFETRAEARPQDEAELAPHSFLTLRRPL